ncbi:unnamed protein product, partial [Cylicostephanus goldi]
DPAPAAPAASVASAASAAPAVPAAPAVAAAPAVSAPLISSEKTTATITKTIVSSDAVVVPETPAVRRVDEGKKDAPQPEINKN